MDEMKHRRLQELDRSDFEIIDGEPDIRGWDVKNNAGLKIGEVEELIVDAQQKKVRYMVVDLDDKDMKLPDRKVLVPIGLAELHDKDDDVILSTVTVDQLGALPAYDKDQLDDDIERKICTALGRTEERASTLLQAAGMAPHTEQTARQRESDTTNTDSHTARTEGHTERTESHQERTERPAMQSVSQPSDTSRPDTPSQTGQPPLGTSEYYGNFYQHAFFNDYNLYKNRQPKTASSGTDNTNTNSDPDYERGLRLWEMRYEGIEDSNDAAPRKHHDREMSDETRLEMVRNRRKTYEERKSHYREDRQHSEDRIRDDQDEHNDHHHRRDNTIIGRIRDEGLQDG
jgi:sporulation protein YlmC with PRC-barrel domain